MKRWTTRLGLIAAFVAAIFAVIAGLQGGLSKIFPKPAPPPTAATTPAADAAPPPESPLVQAASDLEGVWAPDGVTCRDALTITSRREGITIKSGDSLAVANVVEANPAGIIVARGDGMEWTFRLSNLVLYRIFPNGEKIRMIRCP